MPSAIASRLTARTPIGALEKSTTENSAMSSAWRGFNGVQRVDGRWAIREDDSIVDGELRLQW